MLILNSLPFRLLLAFYSVGLLILLYYVKIQVQILLEYNSSEWYVNYYFKKPFFSFQKTESHNVEAEIQ